MSTGSYQGRLTPAQVTAAREWVADCIWLEATEDLAKLSDERIEKGIAKHYSGGIDQFITDCEPVEIGGGQ